ncbi:hypothetical protein ACFQV2_16370 [Actinokineospora soli]|uniref:Uncharacterized protein n=1 Tax=Actinokineospora soli TaxID=1048753 RepID=A0ABW2TN96_9PSEU
MVATLIVLGSVAVLAVVAVLIEARRTRHGRPVRRRDRLADVERATRPPAGAGIQTPAPHRLGSTKADR